MAYISESDLLAKLPAATLLEALDDDADGIADAGVLDSIIASASVEIDGQLSSRHNVPFVSVPPFVKFACLIFVFEMLYERRGWTDQGGKNPWSKKAAMLRKQLEEIGMGTRPLSPAADKLTPNVAVISEASKITGESNFLDG